MAEDRYYIQRQYGDQTYRAPELLGSYRECRRHLADAYEDLRIDPYVDEVILSAKGGPEKIGSVSWWDQRDVMSMLFIRKA